MLFYFPRGDRRPDLSAHREASPARVPAEVNSRPLQRAARRSRFAPSFRELPGEWVFHGPVRCNLRVGDSAFLNRTGMAVQFRRKNAEIQAVQPYPVAGRPPDALRPRMDRSLPPLRRTEAEIQREVRKPVSRPAPGEERCPLAGIMPSGFAAGSPQPALELPQTVPENGLTVRHRGVPCGSADRRLLMKIPRWKVC